MIIHAAFQVYLDNTPDMVFVKDIDLKYAAASLPFVKMVGKKSPDEIIGKTDHEIFQDKNLAQRYVSDDRRLLSEKNDLINYIEPITEEKGKARYGSTSKYILQSPDGQVIGILGVTKDITRDYISRQNYQQELKYLFELPEDAYAVAYMDVDAWRLISQRRQLINGTTLPSCHTVESLCSLAAESISDHNCGAYLFYNKLTPDYLRSIFKTGQTRLVFQYLRTMPNGTVRWVETEIRFLNDVESGNLCAMFSARDIHAQKLKESALEEAAKLDKMTMLFNRETTMHAIGQVLEAHPDQKHALFMIDIDNFKKLNDTLGHQAGDACLVALAQALRKTFREQDIKGRIGGDEFFVLMENIPDYSVAEEKAVFLMEQIRTIDSSSPDIPISVSVGISLFPKCGQNLYQLYGKADAAMYEAKRKGKNQFFIC